MKELLIRLTICFQSVVPNCRFSFTHLGFWSENFFLIAPFPDDCLLVPFSVFNWLYLCAYLFFNGMSNKALNERNSQRAVDMRANINIYNSSACCQ